MRGVSSEGFGRIKYISTLIQLLETDRHFRSYFEQETDVIPQFYVNKIKKDLGPFWEWLPEGAIYHDYNAYLNTTERQAANA